MAKRNSTKIVEIKNAILSGSWVMIGRNTVLKTVEDFNKILGNENFPKWVKSKQFLILSKGEKGYFVDLGDFYSECFYEEVHSEKSYKEILENPGTCYYSGGLLDIIRVKEVIHE